jgi:hypothetical protein
MMKVSMITTQALALALPFVVRADPTPSANETATVEERQANCVLHAIWDSNWRDVGYHRYRVRAWADTNGEYETATEMLDKYCEIFRCEFNTLPAFIGFSVPCIYGLAREFV